MDNDILNNKVLQDKVAFLQEVEILKPVALQTIAGIALVLKETNLKKGEMLFEKGDAGTSMYMIVSGLVKVHDGDYVFGNLGAKQVVGEYALLDTEARSASITAVEDTMLWRFDQDDFYWLMGNIEVAKGMMQVFTKRLRKHNDLQEELALKNQKIAEQHQQIVKENAFIEQQKEEILTQHEKISIQKEEIARQHDMLAVWSKKMQDSIRYAQRIQKATLPTIEEFADHAGESFVYYKPRDVVSGDFYWAESVGHKRIIVAADCTGHGVPGAFITMAGVMLLNQIVRYNQTFEANEILSALNEGIMDLLGQEKQDSEIQDGMEVGVCTIDSDLKEISYAGARMPMVRIYKGEMEVIKGDKEAIGGQWQDFHQQYTKHTFPLKEHAMYYLFSDGYQDQFNGEGKKFMRKKFRDFLHEIHDLPLEKQHQKLKKKMDKWMEGADQTDDIMVVGFKS